jgi:hypothetical protein
MSKQCKQLLLVRAPADRVGQRTTEHNRSSPPPDSRRLTEYKHRCPPLRSAAAKTPCAEPGGGPRSAGPWSDLAEISLGAAPVPPDPNLLQRPGKRAWGWHSKPVVKKDPRRPRTRSGGNGLYETASFFLRANRRGNFKKTALSPGDPQCALQRMKWLPLCVAPRSLVFFFSALGRFERTQSQRRRCTTSERRRALPPRNEARGGFKSVGEDGGRSRS